MLKKLMPLFLCLCSALPIYSYVYGYTRLYRAPTGTGEGTTVDLLYDCHQPNDLSINEMESLPIPTIKKELHPSELRVLEALEKINTSPLAKSVALIWENATEGVPRDSSFIAYSHRLIRRRLRKIAYLYADTSRARVAMACMQGKSFFWGLDPEYTYRGISFRNPIHLCKGRIRKIIARSGKQAWKQLNSLRIRAVSSFKNCGIEEFEKYLKMQEKGSGFAFFHERVFLAFCKLADVEILSHILATSKKRIIVYCGGLHAENIESQLIDLFKFTCEFSYGGRLPVFGRLPDELEPEILASL